MNTVTVSLCNEDGTVYAQQTIEGVTGEWQKFETTFTSEVTENRHVCLAVEIPAGTACFDMISLMPQDTYKGLPIRKDFGEYSLETLLTGAPEQTLYESAVDADGDVILKLVNVSQEEQNVHIVLTGRDMACFLPEADVTVLAGADPKAANSFKEMKVTPQESKLAITDNFEYKVPANSLTVIRLTALKDRR